MLIGVIGSICAGKHTVAEYLIQHHGFLRLHLPSTSQLHRPPSTPPPPHTASYSPSPDHSPSDISAYLAPTVTDQKGTRGLTFLDVDSLLEFVTKRWREHWVLTLTETDSEDGVLEKLMRRPFFLLTNVDAPVGLRYARFRARCESRHLAPLPLDAFIAISDTQLYGPWSLAAASMHQPHARVLNSFATVDALFTHLARLNLPDESRLRPTWDAYFMTLASLASLRSNCMKRRVGAILTTATHRIISTGYNGTPRGLTNCNHGGCPRCNQSVAAGAGASMESLSTCLCLHAEENALLEAGRERIPEGSVLYCDTCPCLTCSVKIAQVGIAEVVYSQAYRMDEASHRVLGEAGVRVRQFTVEKGGLAPEVAATAHGESAVGGELVYRNGSA